MILLAHPTTGHSHAIADILHRAGVLSRYVVSFHYRRGGFLEKAVKVLPGGARAKVERELLRRRRTTVPEDRIVSNPWIELADRVAMRFRGNRTNRHQFLRDFDRYTARLLDEREAGYYGFLNACQLSMRRAKQLGKATFMTMPICHWNLGRRLIREEFARWGMEAAYHDPYPWDEALYNGEMDEELALADVITCGSEFVRGSLLAEGVPDGKLLFNPSGVDVSRFAPKDPATGFHAERRRDPKRKFEIIAVGLVNLRKGSQDLLQAAKLLGDRVRIRLVGRWDFPEKLKADMWQPNVEHVPHVPFSEIPALLRSSDAFVFPTIFEGSSLASYEALASGIPVVTTANCGSVVRDGVDGMLIPIRDPEAIAAAVTRLADDEALWMQYAAAGRQRALEFTWDRYGKVLLDRMLPMIGRTR